MQHLIYKITLPTGFARFALADSLVHVKQGNCKNSPFCLDFVKSTSPENFHTTGLNGDGVVCVAKLVPHEPVQFLAPKVSMRDFITGNP